MPALNMLLAPRALVALAGVYRLVRVLALKSIEICILQRWRNMEEPGPSLEGNIFALEPIIAPHLHSSLVWSNIIEASRLAIESLHIAKSSSRRQRCKSHPAR